MFRRIVDTNRSASKSRVVACKHRDHHQRQSRKISQQKLRQSRATRQRRPTWISPLCSRPCSRLPTHPTTTSFGNRKMISWKPRNCAFYCRNEEKVFFKTQNYEKRKVMKENFMKKEANTLVSLVSHSGCSKGHLVYFVLKNAFSVAVFFSFAPADFESRNAITPGNILNSHNFLILFFFLYLETWKFFLLSVFHFQLSHSFFLLFSAEICLWIFNINEFDWSETGI